MKSIFHGQKTVCCDGGRHGDKNTTLNHVIVMYIGISILCHVLLIIAPFVTLVAGTPFYSIKTYLGLIGAGLVLADIFTNRGLWRGSYCVLLYAICFVAVLSSVRTINYGIKDNMFVICWTVLQFSLFYSAAYRLDREELGKYIRIFFIIILSVWFIACCISLYQYVEQIGYRYLVDPTSTDATPTRQGFIGSRLFGIFDPLNHAAHISALLLLLDVYYIIKEKKVLSRILLSVEGLALLMHIILSGSRGAALSLVFCVFIIAYLLMRGKSEKTGWKRVLISAGIAVGVAAVFYLLCFVVLKDSLAKFPGLTGDIYEDNILERTELDGDVSNNRFEIWHDYFELHDEIGIIGLSPGNYMDYIREHNSNLFIVQYILENYPLKYEGGYIYHPHNGYLMTYVSTGFLGTAFMLAFLLLFFIQVIRYIKHHKNVPARFIFALTIVIEQMIAALFDKGIFFMSSATPLIFWLAMGIVMKETILISPVDRKKLHKFTD